MDGDKRLDFDAPLLSRRRFESNSNPIRSAAPPFYKSDLKTGPIRDPGAVPFLWEQTPGNPKPAPNRSLVDIGSGSDNATDGGDDEEEDDDKFSDAQSYFMNCSVSGMSEATGASGKFERDPKVSDFMMGRFLPAAKAMATGSPDSSWRKPPSARAREPTRMVKSVENCEGRVRYPLNYQEETSCDFDDVVDDEEEDDCYESGNFPSKACGLIPKFCLLNPVPGIKVSSGGLAVSSVRRNRSPPIKAMQHNVSLGQAEKEYSWEAVYKHKLMHANPPRGEDISKLTSESNHLTLWSDSPTADGSSPQCRSSCGGISPYRNEPSQSPFHEGKGFLGVPRKGTKGSKTNGSDSFENDNGNYWIVTPHLHVDTVRRLETTDSNLSSLGTDNKGIIGLADNGSEDGVQSQRIDENLVQETHDRDANDENNGFQASGDDRPLPLKENIQVKNDANPMASLLPPPLPNSPSESWLNRTLPSVSAKNPSAQTFLGIHCQPRKQTFIASSVVTKKEMEVKPSKVQRGQTRFADMLSQPLSPKSEI